jgi:hypothetical protein
MEVNRLYNPIFTEKFFKSAFFTQHHGLIRAIRHNITHAWSQNGDIETKQEQATSSQIILQMKILKLSH